MLLDLARKPLYYSSYLATFEPFHRLIVQKQGLDSQRLLIESTTAVSLKELVLKLLCDISSCVIIYFALKGLFAPRQ